MNEGGADHKDKTDFENLKKVNQKICKRQNETEATIEQKPQMPKFISERQTGNNLYNSGNSKEQENVDRMGREEKILSQIRGDSDYSSVVSKSEAIVGKNGNEFNTGRWTELEHNNFLKAILKYGNEWKMVQTYISSRSSTQARSHAQKFFLRLKKNFQIPENMPASYECGEKRKKKAENHKFDSIFKFLTDYSKNLDNNEEETLSLTESGNLSYDQRKKLIGIVLNFTNNTSDSKKNKRRKSSRRKLTEEENLDENKTEKSSISIEKLDSENYFLSSFIREQNIIKKDQIFLINKLRREETKRINQINDSIETLYQRTNFNQILGELYTDEIMVLNPTSTGDLLFDQFLPFRENEEKKIELRTQMRKISEITTQNNSLSNSICSTSPLVMIKNNGEEKENLNHLNHSQKNNFGINTNFNQTYSNVVPDNKNNIYEEIKSFFSHNMKTTERKLSLISRKSSMRESDVRSIFLNESEKIFSDKVLVEKGKVLADSHAEENLKNPFSLDFDTGSFVMNKNSDNLNSGFAESNRVEYEDISIIY